MRAVLFASGMFALEPMRAMRESSHELLCVVSRPDRPAGRGRTASPTPVSALAERLGLELLKPESLREGGIRTALDSFEPDVGVLVAYGGFLPRFLLESPHRGFVNLHPSLLPRYRGAAPVARALMGGASITGVTTIRMTDRLDAGPILLHEEVPISEEDTCGTLSDKLSHVGAGLLVKTLDELEGGRLTPFEQEEEKATEAPPLKVEECIIPWYRSAEESWRLIRALNPRPGAFTSFRGKRVKVWETHLTDVPPEDEPGTIMLLGREGFLVNTPTGCLQVDVLQSEGKRRMTAAEFARGQRILTGERFERPG